MKLLDLWKKFSKVPGGRWLFSRAIGIYVPYTGSVKAMVMEVSEGFARVRLRERRAIRNHFRCIHALALVNAAELAGSLALSTLQPDGARWIVTGLDTDYHKKARGIVDAIARVENPNWEEHGDHTGTVELRNQDGEIVTTVRMRWRVGPKGSKPSKAVEQSAPAEEAVTKS